jgi:hypothetical protein
VAVHSRGLRWGRSIEVASSSALISSDVYTYGTLRRGRVRSRLPAGTSVAGSKVSRCRAKIRATPSRRVHQYGSASAGDRAQATASAVVTAGA